MGKEQDPTGISEAPSALWTKGSQGLEWKQTAAWRLLPWVRGHLPQPRVLSPPSSASGTSAAPVVSIHPPQLTVQPGQLAEFRCSATGHPQPTLEWTGEAVAGMTFRAWLSWMWETRGRTLGWRDRQ